MAVYVDNQRLREAAVMLLSGVTAQRARNMSVIRRLGPLDLRAEDGEILSSSSGTIKDGHSCMEEPEWSKSRQKA